MNMLITKINGYERCLQNAKKVNWDIEKDVIRNRKLDASQKYLPDSLSLVRELEYLTADEQKLLSQIQGRSYAYIFGLVERFINAKIIEMGQQHALGDQTALEAMVQFSKEELKHQELFRQVEILAQETLPDGYAMAADPNAVAEAVLSKSTWSVLGLTCHIEIFTQVHYKESIKPQEELSELFKDIFKYHWMEEAQHASIDELEWDRVHAGMDAQEIDQAVDDLIDLVVAVDGLLQEQAKLDAEYFLKNCKRSLSKKEVSELHQTVLKAYRWQYIVSGVEVERFQKALGSKLNDSQMQRVLTALSPLINFVH